MKSNKLKLFLTKLLVITILFLSVIITTKKDKNIKTWINDKLLSKNFSFQYIKNMYTKYLGSVLPFDNLIESEPVFDEKLEYKDINMYKDGISLSVTNNYLVPVQYSGIVVYVGEKEGYGYTVIVESEEITIWYSNINSNVKLYDELEKGKYLGEVDGDKLYLVFKKDGKVVDYKEYI